MVLAVVIILLICTTNVLPQTTESPQVTVDTTPEATELAQSTGYDVTAIIAELTSMTTAAPVPDTTEADPCNLDHILDLKRTMKYIVTDCDGGLYEMQASLLNTDYGHGYLLNSSFIPIDVSAFPREILGVFLEHDGLVVLTYGMLEILPFYVGYNNSYSFDLTTGVLIHNQTYFEPTEIVSSINTPFTCAESQEATRGIYRLIDGVPVPFFGKDVKDFPWDLPMTCTPDVTTRPSLNDTKDDSDDSQEGGQLIGECGLVALVVGVILAALLISVMGLLIYMIRTRSPGGRPPSPTKVHPADDQQVPPSKSTLG